jgi:hypothetical protein
MIKKESRVILQDTPRKRRAIQRFVKNFTQVSLHPEQIFLLKKRELFRKDTTRKHRAAQKISAKKLQNICIL